VPVRNLSDIQIEEVREHGEQRDADVRGIPIGPDRGQVDPTEQLGEADEDEDEDKPGQNDQVVPEPGQDPSGERSG
jgi:hypothetical protein